MASRGAGLSDSESDPGHDNGKHYNQIMQNAGLGDSDDDDDDDGKVNQVNNDRDKLKALGLEASDDEFGPDAANEADTSQHVKQTGLAASFNRTARALGPPEVWPLPLVPRPEEHLQVITLKSMVDVESTPYNAEEFTLEDKIAFDDRGRRILRAPVLNRIRYRFKEDDDMTGTDKLLSMESNARIVRWSDDSLSLMIGSECVDLKEEPVDGQRLLLGVKHSSHEVVQAQRLLRSRLVVRPPELESKLHRNMTQQLTPAIDTKDKIKANHVLEDFGHEHMAAVDRDKEQLKIRDRQNKASRKRSHHASDSLRRPVAHKMTAAYLEADEDDDDYADPRSMHHEAHGEKRLLQAKQGKRPHNVLADDDNDDLALSDDDEPPQRQVKRPVTRVLDSDDEF